MHSSKLRGSDFRIRIAGTPATHDDAFASITVMDRVGIVCNHPADGLGAAALLLAHVTAFYDRCRDTGPDFFAYPDNFTFQRAEPVVRYGMLDVWPEHKNVSLPEDRWDALSVVASRAISILIVPEASLGSPDPPTENRHRAVSASLARTVTTAYAYSPTGRVSDPDVSVSCGGEDIEAWGLSVVEQLEGDAREEAEARWSACFVDGRLEQSYRRIGADEAISV